MENELTSHSISVFGLGYVGAVTAGCFSHMGHRVIGVDANASKVEMLSSGRSPVLEPRLEELIVEGRKAGRLHATTDTKTAILQSEISFVCVGTPSQRNGKLDVGAVTRVCQQIGEALRQKSEFHVIVLRSTILPGTTATVVIPALEAASGKQAGVDFSVCVNPEFTREGCAVADFLTPSLTVFGAAKSSDFALLRAVYYPLGGGNEGAQGAVFETSTGVAEMVKYVCNSFHALKVSFANEVGTLCGQLGVDPEEVTRIFVSDTRLNISAKYLTPGFAFGGSCLPKDVRALRYLATQKDLTLPLLQAILPSNDEHIERAVQTVLSVNPRKVGMLGLSFKAGTDDLRESPQVELIKRLLGEGCQVRIWDPYVSMGRLMGSNRQFIEETIPHIGSLLTADLAEVVAGAEVVVIGTQAIDKDVLARHLTSEQIVLDLVNVERSRRLDGVEFYQAARWTGTGEPAERRELCTVTESTGARVK